ncbi:hypothetical protein KM043_012690 [Ampulex compressa]|nr:hypothetical protein KM043_012690 [Ampulex compressa]
MKTLIVLSALLALTQARPGVLLGGHALASLENLHISPVAYAKLVPGAPIGLDGRVVDTPEVAVAKAEHAAAHINERITLANEAVRSADHVLTYAAPAAVLEASAHQLVQPVAIAAKIVPGAPIGPDGRVVDTPEVAVAKAEHAAAHLNEKIGLAEEAAKSAYYEAPILVSSYSAPILHKYLL